MRTVCVGQGATAGISLATRSRVFPPELLEELLDELLEELLEELLDELLDEDEVLLLEPEPPPHAANPTTAHVKKMVDRTRIDTALLISLWVELAAI